jgi:hypothetical protein
MDDVIKFVYCSMVRNLVSVGCYWGGDLWVAMDDDIILTSPDGIHWAEQPIKWTRK